VRVIVNRLHTGLIGGDITDESDHRNTVQLSLADIPAGLGAVARDTLNRKISWTGNGGRCSIKPPLWFWVRCSH
jgi:hypothetical protein